MTELITKAFECRSIDEGSRTADFVASTDVIDAHGEIIDQSSWQLGDFIKNPVVLFAHQSREFPIGKATDVGVRNGQLECRIEFMPEEMNPKAEQVWKMLRAKFLRAVSVGFIPSDGRYEVRNGTDVFVWSGCLLKEISVTPVPANPEALAKMKTLFVESGKGGADAKAKAVAKALSESPQRSMDFPATSPGEHNNGDVGRKAKGMEPKELQEKLDKQAVTVALGEKVFADAEKALFKSEKDLAESAAREKALSTENAALTAQSKSLADARDAEKARADKAEGQIIELEVDALVGVKITAAEKPLYVDLRKQSPELFAKMIAQRDDMKLLKQIVAPTKAGDGVDDIYATMNGGAR